MRPVGRVEEGLHPDAEDEGQKESRGGLGVDVRPEETCVLFCA